MHTARPHRAFTLRVHTAHSHCAFTLRIYTAHSHCEPFIHQQSCDVLAQASTLLHATESGAVEREMLAECSVDFAILRQKYEAAPGPAGVGIADRALEEISLCK